MPESTDEVPRISIITPCYNAVRFLHEAMESVLRQTVGDFEFILVDDGSTDSTAQVIRSYRDSRIRYVRQENRGPSAARNHGVSLARGRYLAFLDADDVALPHRLEVQSRVLDADPALSVVGSGFVWIDEDGTLIPRHHSWEDAPELNSLAGWLLDCPFVPSATLVRRKALDVVGGFAEDLRGGEDWHLWMRLVMAGHRMVWQPQVVCHYRHHGASLSNCAPSMSRDCPEALRRILTMAEFPRELGELGEKALALRYVDSAKRLYVGDLWEQGRVALEKALLLDATLVEGNPCRIEDELIVTALDSLVGDPVAFLQSALDYLPASADLLRGRRAHMFFRCNVELLVRAVQQRDLAAIRDRILPLVLKQPGRLFDRATWAFVLRALGNRLSPRRRR